MDKKTLFAIVLALLVMLGYSYFIQKFYPKENIQIQKTPSLTTSSSITLPTELQKETPAKPSTVSFFEESSTAQTGDKKFQRTKVIDDGYSHYVLSDVGGCVKRIDILRYNNVTEEKPIKLYEALRPNDAVCYIEGFSSLGDINKTPYSIRRPENGILYEKNIGAILELTKKFNFYNSKYGIGLEIKIKNISNEPITGNYSIVGISNIQIPHRQDMHFCEGLIFTGGKIRKFRHTTNKTGDLIYAGPIELVSMQNKYFTLILKPYQNIPTAVISKTVSFSQTKEDDFFYNSVKLNTEDIALNAGEEVIHRYLFYAGPSDPNILASYGEGLEATFRYGFFGWLSTALISTLKFFYRLTHNYGIAIIILTFLIAFLMYPLTFKSLKSMKQMLQIQPKVEKLRIELKANPQKLNKEIMELYKKHKVNPFGGCLPMLLQLPIFMALYQGLSRFIGLKGATFLWIKDLSVPDRAFILPFTLPVIGESINILPILMAIAMFVQQKLSSPTSHSQQSSQAHDTLQAQQRMMGIMMPLLFGFIFYSFPSGLVLYWLMNTIIMLVQQVRITSHLHNKESVA